MVYSLLLAATLMTPRFPAEWEPQESLWMSWPTYNHKESMPLRETYAKLVDILSPFVKVDLLVRSEARGRDVRAFLQARGIDVSQVRMHTSTNAEIWTRDFGPAFRVNSAGQRRIADFGFNFWGYLPASDPVSKAEEGVDRRVAQILNLPVDSSKLISEGGNREFNGAGVLMVVESVERHRNPGMSRAEMEAEYRRLLGVSQVIWLERGVMEDDLTTDGPLPGGIFTVVTTGGHVDNVARFVSEDTVLVAHVSAEEAAQSPIARETRRRMLRNEAILQKVRLADGRRLKLVRMPTPGIVEESMGPGDGIYEFIKTMRFRNRGPIREGERIRVALAGSYLNFVITNGLVLTSRFAKPGRDPRLAAKDATCVAILERSFPTRRVVALDTDAVNIGGGGLHCITQQMPAVNR